MPLKYVLSPKGEKLSVYKIFIHRIERNDYVKIINRNVTTRYIIYKKNEVVVVVFTLEVTVSLNSRIIAKYRTQLKSNAKSLSTK